MMRTQSGYDSAVSSRDEDFLERWGFAEEIFTLAASCPEDWSVRIAIYGGWGTGKTTVLKFIHKMAQDANHVVIWFKPWGSKDSASLWRDFINGVLGAVREHPLGPDLGRLRFRERNRKIAEAMGRLSKASAQTEKFVSAGIGFLENWLKSSRDDLREISAYFRGHRIVVLVDDLDRTTPNLVPEVLHALKEILDLPGFSFVLGFDRERVGAALAAHHPGWGNGLDFLDKVIDFPRWIPSPHPKALARLAEHDLKKYASFVDSSAFRQITQIIPSNPRALRKFIRGLWSLKKEIGRYGPDEIDWVLILLLAIFRSQWPVPSEKILQEEMVEQLIISEARFNSRDSKEDGGKASPAMVSAVEQAGIAKEEQEEAISLLRKILQTSGFRPASNVAHHAFLVEHPLPLTQREFLEIFGRWIKDPRSSIVFELSKAHALKSSQPLSRVLDSVFNKAIETYNRYLGMAADSASDEGLVSSVHQALHALKLVEVLSVQLGGFSGECPFFDEAQFVSLVGLANRWAHFTKHRLYPSLRAEEQQLAIRVASEGKLDPIKIWGRIGPHGEWRHVWFEEAPKLEFLRKLEDVFVPKIAEKVLRLFEDPHALDSVLFDRGRFVEQNLLLDRTSAVWSGSCREKFLHLAGQANESAVIHENMFSFFRGIDYLRSGDDTSLLEDQEIILALWHGVIARRLNPRMAGSIEKNRSAIEKAMGYSLKTPSWWAEVVLVAFKQEQSE